MTSRQRAVGALESPDPRPRADRPGRQPDGHPQVRLPGVARAPGHSGRTGDHGRRAAVGPAVRSGARAVPRRYAVHRGRGGRRVSRAAIEQNRRDGRLWHDLRDEFGVGLVDARRPPLLHGHLPPSAGRGHASTTLRTTRSPRATIPAGSPGCGERALRIRNETPYAVVSGISGVVYEICWYMRGLERWLMDLLTRAGVLRGPAGPDAEVLARLVPAVLRRGGRPGRRDHDRRRPGRPERSAVPARRFTGRSSSRGTSGWSSTSARARAAKIWYHTCGSCVAVHPRPARQRHRHPQPRAGERQGHGPGGAEGRASATGWRSGAGRSTPSTCCPTASPRDGARARAPEPGGVEARRRLRLQQRPQHPGRRAAGEHRRPVRRGV